MGQVGAKMSQDEVKLGPSWGPVGPNWGQVGAKMLPGGAPKAPSGAPRGLFASFLDHLGAKMLICWNTSVSYMKTSIDNGCATPPPPEVLCVLCVVLRALQNEDSAPEGFLKLWGRRLAWFGCQKVGKSHPKSVLWRSPALWGDLRRPLGRLWVAFGVPGVPKSRLWASFGLPLGGPWGHLGVLGVPFGFLWGALGGF